MAIVRWDPWQELAQMQGELNKLFGRAFGAEGRGVRDTAWAPAIDMFERDDALVVRAELPGIKVEDVDISFIEDRLVIKGERRFEEEVKEDNFYRLEQRYGSFARAVQVPFKVKDDDVKATYKEGVLEVVLPKAEEEKPKQIKISVEDK